MVMVMTMLVMIMTRSNQRLESAFECFLSLDKCLPRKGECSGLYPSALNGTHVHDDDDVDVDWGATYAGYSLTNFSPVRVFRSVLQEMKDALVHDLHAGNLKELELATHNFGVENLLNHLTLFDTYFGVLMKNLQIAGKGT